MRHLTKRWISLALCGVMTFASAGMEALAFESKVPVIVYEDETDAVVLSAEDEIMPDDVIISTEDEITPDDDIISTEEDIVLNDVIISTDDDIIIEDDSVILDDAEVAEDDGVIIGDAEEINDDANATDDADVITDGEEQDLSEDSDEILIGDIDDSEDIDADDKTFYAADDEIEDILEEQTEEEISGDETPEEDTLIDIADEEEEEQIISEEPETETEEETELLEELIEEDAAEVQEYEEGGMSKDGFVYELSETGLTIAGYSGSSSVVNIPSQINGYRVTAIGKRAFENNHTMRSLTIPETVTYIGTEAFFGCAGLSTINFNAKNCTVPEVWKFSDEKGYGVFSGAGSASANGLTVNIGYGVKRVPDGLFDTASTSEYGHDGYPFAYVTAVNFASTVTEIGNRAFYNCRELDSVNLGSNITTVGEYAFWNCVSMQTLTVPASLTTIETYAFSGCSSLKQINWSSGLNSIGDYAFSECTSLNTLSLPNPLTTVGKNAFANCTRMTSLTLPKSLTYLSAEAFYGCIKLNKININCTNLSLPEVWIYSSDKGVGVFSGAGSASPNGLTVTFGSGVKRVPDNLFNTASTSEYGHNGYPYAYVTAVVFADTVSEIGANAFYNCKELTAVKLGNGIKKINSYAFWNCVSMTTFTADNRLTSIGERAFSDCTSLNKIVWGTGLDKIGINAFSGCNALTSLSLPQPLTTVERNAFSDCIALASVTLPESLTNLGAEAFSGCVKLQKLTINSISLSVPEVWIYSSDKGIGVFSGAGSASAKGFSVTFGNKVTKIPDNLFDTASTSEYGHNGYEFAYITSVTIPENITYIGTRAFNSCQTLGKVTVYATKPEMGTEVFLNCTHPSFRIYGYYGSTVIKYAKENSHPYKLFAPEKSVLTDAVRQSGSIRLSWKKVNGVQGYMIYRRTPDVAAWEQIAKVSSGKSSYKDTSAEEGNVYIYTIRSYAGSTKASYDNTGITVSYLPKISMESVENISSGVKLTWEKGTGISGYFIYRGEKQIATVKDASKVTYIDKTVSAKNGSKYKYSVRPYKSVSGTKYEGEATDQVMVVRLTTPYLKKLSSKKSKKITVRWNGLTKISGMEIEYARKKSFANSKTVTVSGTSAKKAVLSGLKGKKTYYVRIRSYRTVSGVKYYSDWSTVRNIKAHK